MMLAYQKTVSMGYPFDTKKLQITLGLVWVAIGALNLFIIMNHVGKCYWVVSLYSNFEMVWEGLLIAPYWARRRVILYQAYMKYFYGQNNETLFEKGEILQFVIHYLVKAILILVFVFI